MQYCSAKAQLVSSCPTFHLAHMIRGLGGVLQESGFILIFSTLIRVSVCVGDARVCVRCVSVCVCMSVTVWAVTPGLVHPDDPT